MRRRRRIGSEAEWICTPGANRLSSWISRKCPTRQRGSMADGMTITKRSGITLAAQAANRGFNAKVKPPANRPLMGSKIYSLDRRPHGPGVPPDERECDGDVGRDGRSGNL